MLTTAYRVHVALSFTHSRLVKHRAGPAVAPGTFAIEGDLAESWSQPSETTYVFKLRRGVRWHPKPPVNGRELTSADVKYTIERFLGLKGNPSAYMPRAVDRVETPDAYTVRFVLKEPSMTYGPQTPFVDPDNYIYGTHYPDELKNQSHVNHPVVTDLLVRQRCTADPARRREILAELQRYLARQQYYVQLASAVTIAVGRRAQELRAEPRRRLRRPPDGRVARPVRVES